MHNFADISLIEWVLHALLFLFVIIMLVMIFIAYRKISKGEIKRIMLFYWFAFFFSAIRWIGGTLARINFDFVSTLGFNIFWTSAGIISGLFGIYGSYLLLKFSRIYGFPKSKSEVCLVNHKHKNHKK